MIPRSAHYPSPVADRIGPISYAELQKAGDVSFPRGHRFYWKAQFLDQITDAAANALIERFPSVPSPRSFFVFQQVGGAISRVPPAATAYANRQAAYDSFPVSIWSDPAADEANIAWAREMYTVLQPFGMGGVYVNNLGDEGPDRVKAAYGENYDRLVKLKRKYDPDNLFRLNQNVNPWSPMRSPSLSSTTSPTWMPQRNSMRRSAGTPARVCLTMLRGEAIASFVIRRMAGHRDRCRSNHIRA
jgi:hypothetical protein